MKIETKYDIKQKVCIIDLGLPGRVLAIFIGDSGIQYKVQYVCDGTYKDAYLFEDELSE